MATQQLIGTGQLNYTLNLKARYYQTAAIVGAGKANAIMGLILLYQ